MLVYNNGKKLVVSYCLLQLLSPVQRGLGELLFPFAIFSSTSCSRARRRRSEEAHRRKESVSGEIVAAIKKSGFKK